MAGGALLFLVIGDPTAVEVQLLVLLLQSKECASAWERDATDVLRYFLAPFVFTGDMGAVVGNFAIVAGIVILHLVVVATYRAAGVAAGGRKRKAGQCPPPTWAEASAAVFFPAVPFAVASALYVGTASHTMKAFVAANNDSGLRGEAAVAGVLGLLYLLAVPAAAAALLRLRPGVYAHTTGGAFDPSGASFSNDTSAASFSGSSSDAFPRRGSASKHHRQSKPTGASPVPAGNTLFAAVRGALAPRGVWVGPVERRLGMATHGQYRGGRHLQGGLETAKKTSKEGYADADVVEGASPERSQPHRATVAMRPEWFTLLPFAAGFAASVFLDGIPMACAARYALALGICLLCAAVLAAVRPHRSPAVSFLSSGAFGALGLLCVSLLVRAAATGDDSVDSSYASTSQETFGLVAIIIVVVLVALRAVLGLLMLFTAVARGPAPTKPSAEQQTGEGSDASAAAGATEKLIMPTSDAHGGPQKYACLDGGKSPVVAGDDDGPTRDVAFGQLHEIFAATTVADDKEGQIDVVDDADIMPTASHKKDADGGDHEVCNAQLLEMVVIEEDAEVAVPDIRTIGEAAADRDDAPLHIVL